MSAKALVLINYLSRQGNDEIDPVLDVLRSGSIEPIVFRFRTIEEISRQLAIHRAGLDRIVIGGGDGTLNASIASVKISGLPLGILPMGTANDLARTLRIPFDLQEAARVVLDGRIERIDLGVVNGLYFFNAASIGLPVKITRALSTEMKRRWGGLAYPIAFLKAFRENRHFTVRVRSNGRTEVFRSIQITVGNGRHYGRGMSIRDDAEIVDHLLHCYSLKPQSFWQLLRTAPSLYRGTFSLQDPVRLLEGRRIEIVTRKPMAIDIDGELIGRTPALFSIDPAALPVIVPK